MRLICKTFSAILVCLLAASTSSALSSEVLAPEWASKYSTEKTNENLQAKIDGAYKRIFLTKTGRYLCGLFGSPQTLSNFTGASLKQAAEIETLCGQNFSSLIKNDPLSRRKPVDLVFLYTGQKDFSLRSWSDRQNHTYLFYDDATQITEESLIGRLGHEIAIRLDQTDAMRSGYLIYDFAPDMTSVISAFTNVYYSPSNACSALHLFGNPILRVYFNAARASTIEKQLLLQTGVEKVPSLENKGTCLSRVIEGLPLIEDIPVEILKDSDSVFPSSFSMQHYANERACGQFNEKTMIDDLRFLDQETVFSKGNIKSLCEYFETPSFAVWTFTATDGPAPRIGGGWKSSQILISASANEQLRATNVFKAELKTMHKSEMEKVEIERADTTDKNFLKNRKIKLENDKNLKGQGEK